MVEGGRVLARMEGNQPLFFSISSDVSFIREIGMLKIAALFFKEI